MWPKRAFFDHVRYSRNLQQYLSLIISRVISKWKSRLFFWKNAKLHFEHLHWGVSKWWSKCGRSPWGVPVTHWQKKHLMTSLSCKRRCFLRPWPMSIFESFKTISTVTHKCHTSAYALPLVRLNMFLCIELKKSD